MCGLHSVSSRTWHWHWQLRSTRLFAHYIIYICTAISLALSQSWLTHSIHIEWLQAECFCCCYYCVCVFFCVKFCCVFIHALYTFLTGTRHLVLMSTDEVICWNMFFFHLSFCWLYKFIFATDHKFEQITVKCRNDPMIELKTTFVIDACKMRSVQSNLFPRKMYWRKFNLAGLVSFEAHLQFRSTVRAILFDTDKFICEKKKQAKTWKAVLWSVHTMWNVY